MLSVYLCGPITGLSYGETLEWRDLAKQELRSHYNVVSPMRGKEYLSNETKIADSYSTIATSGDKGIFHRDQFDVAKCDVLLVNFLGAKDKSIGSVMEIQKAYDLGKYILLVMEPGNPNDHSFVREAASLQVDDLDYAFSILKGLASGYLG